MAKHQEPEHPIQIMCKYDIDCVKRRTEELMQKYPGKEQEILKALNISSKLSDRKLSSQQMQDLLNPDELLMQYGEFVENQSFDHQTRIRKVLIEEAGGDS